MKKYGAISFWEINDTPNQSYIKLEIYTSAEEQKYVINKNFTRIKYDSTIGDNSWSQGTKIINNKHCFKVRMNNSNVG